MSGEVLGAIIAALATLALSQFGLWMRMEHRMTKLETIMELLRNKL